jgi:17beta-estradiol 17-dehydrogenase / very-long-chain 3-oxoacyl-CoA reductase
MKPLDLVKSYGRDSWAVITVSSDGIGLAIGEK